MLIAIFAYIVMLVGTGLSLYDMGMSAENMIICGIDIVIGILFLITFGVL